MENIFIRNLHKKSVKKSTSKLGLFIRRKIDKPFKKLSNLFSNVNIIRLPVDNKKTDEEYYSQLSPDLIPVENYPLVDNKHNIVVERYPKLEPNEPYIFLCNHTCPEDIETVLNVIDRNAYLLLGSIDFLKNDPDAYLLYLNGVIPFDIADEEQRRLVFPKMLRVLKTNSILFFPEGSHNHSPNNLINPLFDGQTNLALETGTKIIITTMIRDEKNNVSYVDFGNPIEIGSLNVDMSSKPKEEDSEKYYVNSITKILRDKMATAVYYLMSRHISPLNRSDYINLEEEIRMEKIRDSFDKMKWKEDIFDAEFLTKKPRADKEHEEVVRKLSNLSMSQDNLSKLSNRYWVLKEKEMDDKDVVIRMRKHLKSLENVKRKVIKRKK